MDGFFGSLFGFFFYLVDVVSDFASIFQWALTNISAVFSAFFSLLAFVKTGISFLGTFVSLLPPFLLPFFLLLLAYWLIMFIIKIGG